ncbi:uncharacterized protein LOC134541072 [Bacillus rossius redtenbacheri]|uniref:uncharacterized protein LOC134541072 n=1 Tax=Bacillus rossius redtenbacheri TaxID=93214 RepID=UPI002FDD934B
MEAAGGGQCVCRRGAGRKESCEEMPQMVPVSGLSPAPCDYAHFAADSFDLSLLECGAGDGEVPYSPTSIHQLLSLFAEQPCSPPLMFHPPARVKDEPLESLESLESLECLEPPAEDHRLLREVLRDTSFQRRHNVRALDLETLARRAQDLVREEAEDRLYLSPGAFQRGQHPLDPVKGEVEDRQYLSPEAFQRRQQPQDPVKGEVENRGYLSLEAFQRRHHPLDSVKGEVEDHQYLSTAFQRQQPQDPVKGEVEERMYLSPGAFQRQEHSLDPVKGEVEERMYLSPEAFQRQQPPVDPAKGQALVPQAMDVEPEDESGPLKEEALSPGSSQQDCLEHMEPVLSLAIQQLQRDVDDTCSVLGIASDPGQWTVDDVKAWLLWTLRQYNLPMIPMDYFAVDGVTLSALSEEEFQQRSPQVSRLLARQVPPTPRRAPHSAVTNQRSVTAHET